MSPVQDVTDVPVHSQARSLGFTLTGFDLEPDIHVMMNMYWEALDMEVPAIAAGSGRGP
jgi:hypothetical protein